MTFCNCLRQWSKSSSRCLNNSFNVVGLIGDDIAGEAPSGLIGDDAAVACDASPPSGPIGDDAAVAVDAKALESPDTNGPSTAFGVAAGSAVGSSTASTATTSSSTTMSPFGGATSSLFASCSSLVLASSGNGLSPPPRAGKGNTGGTYPSDVAFSKLPCLLLWIEAVEAKRWGGCSSSQIKLGSSSSAAPSEISKPTSG
mmetsp:Transcript_16821/g.48919  ORF Transcript_16821/g.48919 Transcript_16821/m.48919 type:complete len:200 (-) Transcript_16821:748-1347(-)